MATPRPYYLTIRNYIPGNVVCDRTLHIIQMAGNEEQAKRAAVSNLKRAQPFLFKDEQFEVVACTLDDEAAEAD